MRILWIYIAVFWPVFATSQAVIFQPDSIPLINGEVVFGVGFDFDLSQSQYNARINQFLSKQFNPVSGEITEKTPGITRCRVTDYISIGDNFFQSFGIYMLYDLTLTVADGHAQMRIDNIKYLEQGYYDTYVDPSDTRTIPLYTAAEIMIDQQFKQLFVRNASSRITEASLERINSIAADLHALFEVNEN